MKKPAAKKKGKPRARAKKGVGGGDRRNPRRVLPPKKRGAKGAGKPAKRLAKQVSPRKRSAPGKRAPVRVRAKKRPAPKPKRKATPKVASRARPSRGFAPPPIDLRPGHVTTPGPKPFTREPARPLSLRVLPGRVTGEVGPSGRKAVPDPAKLAIEFPDVAALQSISLTGLTIAQALKKLERAAYKLKGDQIKAERARLRSLVGRDELRDKLEKTREFLQVVSTAAEGLGHAVKLGQETNRDGTADLQLVVGTWGDGPYAGPLLDLFDAITGHLPAIEKGIRFRPAIRIRAANPDDVRFKYLPNVGNMRTIYYNYTLPRNLWGTLSAARHDVDKHTTAVAHRLIQFVLDARFDPRWIGD